MASLKFLLMCLSFPLLLSLSNGAEKELERKAYIVYMGEGSGTPAVDHHHSLLRTVVGDEKLAMEHRIHSYGRSINAFAARLLPHEAEHLERTKGVISVLPNTIRKLRTTGTWDFLKLPMSAKRNNAIESNIIVGLIDTGIYVDNPSFSDSGYAPPNTLKWKGSCDKGPNFTGCNNKVIGARYYHLSDSGMMMDDVISPADFEGHGTHTASTAAGVEVEGTDFYGMLKGTARGGVPSARIAMYKACWFAGCSDMNLLAAFDDAIADGVDLLSISIGGFVGSYFKDSIAIGSFHATKKGIAVICAAGNDGPRFQTVDNVAPWIFTIAATGIDRKFVTDVKLGNGKKFSGTYCLNTFTPRKKIYPLTDGIHSANRSSGMDPSTCDVGSLDPKKVRGKIVYCAGSAAEQNIKESGGVGTIISTSEMDEVAFTFLLPTAVVTSEAGDLITKYINSTKNPTAVIKKSRVEKRVAAPYVPYFSSRGPSLVSDLILKPDIAAPGTDVLAGWTRLTSVTEWLEDDRYVDYNVISGTSMATPHVAGAAAYVKSFHPDWSPAAIKSALMTTATEMKSKSDNKGVFEHGAGHVNPSKAVHPGLIYDIKVSDYIRFLCKDGYDGIDLGMIIGEESVDCSKYATAKGGDGLNYPSMQFVARDPNKPIRAVFVRTVTNVGLAKSVYKAKVKASKGVSVRVVPEILKFSELHEKKSFKVLVEAEKSVGIGRGTLEWTDSKHSVRSPIVVLNANVTWDD